MGAYLYYKLEEKSQANEANDFLETNKTNKELKDEEIYFSSSADIIWAEKNNPQSVDYFKGRIGTGDIKVSGVNCRCDLNEEDLLEKQTVVFEELNKKFGMKYFANSCAFSEEEYYFTLEQMKRITDNGKLLSGKTSKNDRVVELYNKYYTLFSEPVVELFDISIIKDEDSVLIDDVWREIEYVNYRDQLRLKYLHNAVNGCIDDFAEKIKGHKKHIHKIRYSGAIVDIEAYVIDSGTLVYLETVGTENMVKSVTSVLMQGRMKMNNHTVNASFGHFSINKAGNKRKIIPLDDGVAHSITYHSPSISETGFSVLIGRDNDELIDRFSAWLENTNHLPYPKNLTKEIYEELKNREKLEVLTSVGVEAIKIDISILEEDAIDLQEIIIKVCKDNGLINTNAKPLKQKAPLPKSKYLRENQVQKIMDTLDGMPKTYELDGVDIKPIGLKLFSSNMTLYITEADIGSEDDEFTSKHTQCFGYVKNESDSMMSEWGYINVPYYLEMIIGIGGFEQDLYFDDMYIDSDGRVNSKEKLEEIKRLEERAAA